MPVLTTAITPDTTPINVDGPVTTAYPGRFLLDAEIVYVHGGSGFTSLSVTRGADGTTAAAHARGTALVACPIPTGASGGGGSISITDGTTTVDPATSLVLPAGTLTALGSGDAGVAFELRRLGPYRVTYETPGIEGDQGSPIEIVADVIPAGSTIIKCWGLPVSEWATPDDVPKLAVYVGPVSSQATVLFVPDCGDSPISPPSNAHAYQEDPTEPGNGVAYWTVKALASVWMTVNDASTEAAPTSGAADIYLIIATPAA